jgi:hypothetical protein
MKKLLVGEKPTVREVEVQYQGRNLIVSVGPVDITYRLKGLGKDKRYVLRHADAIPVIKGLGVTNKETYA